MKVFYIVRKSMLAVCLLAAAYASAQQPETAQAQQDMHHAAAQATPLASLIEEARAKNPQGLAALHAYKAAANMPKHAGALPDTQVMLQQFSVGSPRPFAGYTNSDFAYIGVGASQEFPYPGKRKLRAEVAGREADALQAQSESAERQIVERVKTTYFRLAYAQQARAVLEHHVSILDQVAQVTESRYRVGKGNQQEVLKAQLQHTKMLQQITMTHREEGELQAKLKQLLARPQDSPDIVAEPLAARELGYSSAQLLQLAREQNSEVHSRAALLQREQSRVDLAQKEFRPDFSVQYMYQNTDRKFRDYYMLSLGINLPNRGRRRAELAEANESRQRARQELEMEIQRQLAEVQNQFVAAKSSAEQLQIYKQGLIPQAQATLESAMAAYGANRQDFETLLSSFLDVLDLDLQYQRELAEHESALARIESLTGVTLP